MEAIELKRGLLNWTLANSGAEHRDYLGMSAIGQCSLRLYKQMIYGREWSTSDHLYCERGYAEEQRTLMKLASLDGIDISQLPLFPYAAFRARLNELIARRQGCLGPDREFSDFGGRFQGHSDGSWEGDLLEIKSVTQGKLESIRGSGKLPRENYQQVQCMLHYGRYQRALVIYVARDTGDQFVLTVRYSEQVGEALKLKATTILEAVDHRVAPECECGWCEAGSRG